MEEAKEAYQRAISLKPDYPEAYFNLGNVLKSSELFEDAVEVYQKAIAIKGDYAKAHNNLGNAYLKLQNHCLITLKPIII